MPHESTGGIITLVSRIEEGNYYTISQVARQLERNVSSVKRWLKKNPKLRPTHRMDIGAEGNNYVWLYTDVDISRLKKHRDTLKPGRPKKEK